MKAFYKVITLIVFVSTLLFFLYSYVQYSTSKSYWGTEWENDFWLTPGNNNVEVIQFSKKENLLIKSIVNSDDGYRVEFFKENITFFAEFKFLKSAVYYTDSLGNILPGNNQNLIQGVNKSGYVTYYKGMNSEDFIIESIVL